MEAKTALVWCSMVGLTLVIVLVTGVLGLVDWTFLDCWLRWPLMVASDLGRRCLLTSSAVRPGHVVKYLALMAMINVEVAGLKQVGCKKATRLALVLHSMML